MGNKMFRAYDILGNIAIVKFSEEVKLKSKIIQAKKILNSNKSIKTVVEKTGKFKGRLRLMETKHLVGEKTKEVLYKENNCNFRFNLDTTYFSSRLSNERKEIAGKIKKNDKVLVMFAGVGPFSIVIAKNSGANVISNEINRKANNYGKINIDLNNLKQKIEIVSGDVKKLPEKLKQKFDVIVMPRPQLKDSFLQTTFKLSKKGTKIYYYDFCKQDEIGQIIEKIKLEAKKAKKKIRILNQKIAGEVGPYRVRCRIDFKII